jgi:hypothetical protein
MFPRSLFPAPHISAPLAAAGPPSYWFGGYTELGITAVRIVPHGTEAFVSWVADATVPPGVFYQIYINGQLRWHGATPRATVAIPPGVGSTAVLHVGRVWAVHQAVDYENRLIDPPGSGNRARLGWVGGRWLDVDIDHYNIYMSKVDPIDIGLTPIAAQVPAAPGGLWGDGYGRGPHGRGPHGRGTVGYSWVSGPLARGPWSFLVASVDRSGNLSADNLTVTLEIEGPPPAPPSVGGRAAWIESYDQPTRTARLAWNPSED